MPGSIGMFRELNVTFMNPDYMHCKPSTGEELKVKILTSKVDKLLEMALKARNQQIDVDELLSRIGGKIPDKMPQGDSACQKAESYSVVEKLNDLEEILCSIIDSSSANISRLNDLV